MPKFGTTVAALAVGAVAVLTLSGGTSEVPQTPPALEGRATPFLGVAVIGSGGAAAAIDDYGNVVELRAPGPAGAAVISTSYKRQRAGSVDPRTGIVLMAGAGERTTPSREAEEDGPELQPLWRADRLSQRYLPRSNVLETEASVAGATVRIRDAMAPTEPVFAREIEVRPDEAGRNGATGVGATSPVGLEISLNFDFGGREREVDPDGLAVEASDGRTATCAQQSSTQPSLAYEAGNLRLAWQGRERIEVSLLCRFRGGDGEPSDDDGVEMPAGSSTSDAVREVLAASRADTRATLGDTARLGPGAPDWAQRLHERSLLALLALTDRDTGAMPAGLRDHWQYIWPRDAGTAALAFNAAGLRERAGAIAGFIAGLDVEHAARFHEDGSPVADGRHEQGDSIGWARLAFRAAGLPASGPPGDWRGRGDYGERDDERGDFLGNAIVAGATAAQIEAEFRHGDLLVREAVANSEKGSPRTTSTDSSGNDSLPALDTAVAWAARPFPRPRLFPLVRATLLELAADAGPFGLYPSTDWSGHDPWTAATASTAWSLAALGERRAALGLLRSVRAAATPLWLLPERVNVSHGAPRSTTPLAWSHAFTLLALQEIWG